MMSLMIFDDLKSIVDYFLYYVIIYEQKMLWLLIIVTLIVMLSKYIIDHEHIHLPISELLTARDFLELL